jgi:hypothetical protein
MEFKKFLLTEQRDYLSQKVGDVLTGVHELVQGGKQVGARQLVRHSEGIVNQIRKILHSSWPRTEFKYLRKLQKCGVGLAKCIDEKGDLREVLNSVRHELEQLSQKLGEPINTLGSPKKKDKLKPPEEPKDGQDQAMDGQDQAMPDAQGQDPQGQGPAPDQPDSPPAADQQA